MTRIAIYSRKSKFTGKGDSIGNQIEMCKNYIANLPIEDEIDISVFEDEGYSGKNLERPSFQKMMEIHEIKPFDYLVVYRLDRISRNVGDCAKLIEQLKATQTQFISVSEHFDTSTSAGVAMLNMATVFAQLERDNIAERIKDNMYMLAQNGRWTGGTTPLGYKSVKHTNADINGKSRSYYTLEIDEDTIGLVKLIFSKYSELQSLNAVEIYLNDTKNLTPNGKEWGKANVKRILENPIYCIADKDSLDYFIKLGSNVCFTKDDCDGIKGIIPYNRRIGEKNTATTPDKWVIAISTHKGIYTGEEWIRIQNLLKENSKNCYGGVSATKQSFNKHSILSGVLYCSCGAYMRPKLYASGKMAYMCIEKEKSKKAKCSMPNIDGTELDKVVLNELFSFNLKNSNVSKQIALLRKKVNNVEDDIYAQIKSLNAKKAENIKSIENLVNALASGANQVTMDIINKKMTELTEHNTAIDAQLDELSHKDDIQTKMHSNINNLETAIIYLKDNFDRLSIENKREYIKKIIDKIVWDGEKAHIFIKGSTV